VSTEWIVLVWLKMNGYYYCKKGVYVQVIRSTARHIVDGGNTVPHETFYVRKTNLLKPLEIAIIYEENF